MLNKVILIGRLGGDPELRYILEGKPVCVLNVATNEYVIRGEEKEVITEWHRVIVFGKMGEAVAEHLNKGDKIYVEGRIRSREYEDKNGAKKRVYEIISNKVLFLELRNKGGGGIRGIEEEDIPF